MKKAWLITNEYLNTNKYMEINLWLAEAAKKQGVELFIKTNADVLAYLSSSSGWMKEPDIEFVLFMDKDVRLAKYLEYAGYYVFNSAKAIEICDDKSLTHLVLQHNGIPMPETITAPMTFPLIGYTNYKFLDDVVKKLDFPMIVKECFGSFGQQVYLVKSIEELQKKVEEIGTKPMLFQKYISTSFAKDLRLQVVGNKVIASMYRYTDSGDFRANISAGGKMKPYEPTEKEKEMAVECCRLIGLDFGGVDLLFGENENPIVCEVNSNAHFKNIYDCTSINVADKIIQYILNKLQGKIMNIETSRLVLIPVSEEYVKDIFENFNEQIIKYMMPKISEDIDEMREVVQRFIQQRKVRTDDVFAITIKSNDEFLGLVGLHNLKDEVPEIGIWTKVHSHGNHYGREAVGGVMDYAKSLGIKKVCYPVDRRNVSSKKIALFYGGKLAIEYKEVETQDGRILEEEIYEIEI